MENIHVGHGSKITIFDIVGFAQEIYKGNHFGALAMVVENSKLSFRHCPYEAQLSDDELLDRMSCLSVRPGKSPIVFEHFLQCVRRKYPGIGFAELYYVCVGDYQHIGPRPAV